eukprot:CAMPEP_0179855890 /NCGR_PEP_ID=MMETSP0982-20121206/10803_1 /TAXON_ID=483367 /ORGANISM="non described non described, Strain CCMP 2436" /LENGTH=109 /DNA_ID=CAMNT_0021742063 /DNA_START=322 /DNA_END=651 /DNA_ORIENTATION=+
MRAASVAASPLPLLPSRFSLYAPSNSLSKKRASTISALSWFTAIIFTSKSSCGPDEESESILLTTSLSNSHSEASPRCTDAGSATALTLGVRELRRDISHGSVARVARR